MTASRAKLDKTEIYSFLKSTTPFDYLGERVLEAIAQNTKQAHFPEGSKVFREGEPSKKTLFLIYEGRARAVAAVGDKNKVTASRSKGEFFGVTVLLSDEPYPVSMVAATDLTCLLIGEESFQKALASSDRFAEYFTKDLASRLKELYLAFTDSRSETHFAGEHTLRQKIADVWTEKVITCLPMDKISDVAKKMSGNNISSVVVAAFNNKPVGIITERDLVSKVLSADNPDLERRAFEVMSSDLITVRPDDFSYKALLLMTKHNLKHIVVTDEQDVLHGIVTVKDLVKSRKDGALSIVNQIEYQHTFSELAGLTSEIDRVQQALLAERSYASEICALVNELYDRVTRRVIEIAEEEMLKEGRGKPPGKYSFINMGSAGRKEQFSRTDQDNGIIFEDTSPEKVETAADYFITLGKKIVRGLEACGFARCKGKVMAENPYWCMPLTMWESRAAGWAEKLDPKDIRNMTIFLDYRHVAGEEMLYDRLKIFTTRLFKEAVHALLFMAEDDTKQRVPLNMFRQIITEKNAGRHNRLNIKNTATVHLVDCIRIFALREGIMETNTFERIHRLKDRGIFKPDDAEYFEAAYESLLMFRIRDAVEKAEKGESCDNYINLDLLSRKDKAMLKEALLVVNRLQSMTAHAFHVHKA